MLARAKWFVAGTLVLAMIGMSAGVAAADSLLTVTPTGGVGLKDGVASVGPEVSVTDYGEQGFRVSVNIAGVNVQAHKTEFGEFVRVRLGDSPIAGEIGAPAIPVVRGLFIAPMGANVTLGTQTGPGYVADGNVVGARLRPTPMQPPVPKTPGALENAEFVYDPAAYNVDFQYGPSRATVTELGTVRGQRLMLLEIWPVSYNPAAEELTFWTTIVADVQFTGGAPQGTGLSPLPNLHRVVLNPSAVPALAGGGSGNYLIVVAQTFETDIAAFAAAKTAQGFTVSTYVVPPGTSNTQIKSYIQSLWGGPSSPDYILLVGDTNTIPAWSGDADNDLMYACMDGPTDWYPDIAIGRFSARTSAQLQILVDKTLYYENGPLADPDYLKRAVFMASVDNYQISEGTHNYVIDTWLEPNEYICDRLYQVTYGATTQDVRDSFNDGRFYGVYSGHGSSTSWADGPPFSQNDVRNLVNENMYSLICSFACSTGDFDSYDECFMETWVRVPNKGAVTAWGSSVSSYWTEDDILERVLFDAIFDNDDDVLTEAGPIFNESKYRYLAHFGPGGRTRMYFEMYNQMGDPSHMLPSSCSDAGTVMLDSSKYACEDTAMIRVSDCGLNENNNVVETVIITVDSTSEPGGEEVLLTETSTSSATFEGTVDLSETNAVGVLLVGEGDVVTATYIDEDDGQGHHNVVVTDQAVVDCTPPVISDVEVVDIQPRAATIQLTTDEPARGIVHYGLDCGNLNQTAYGGGYSTTPTVTLGGLQTNTTYYFAVEAEDEAGNVGAEGNCYSFATPEIPDFFTEHFDTSGFDMDNTSLRFVANGSNDYYLGCAESITELPTNPAGGTSLPLSDDDYEPVTVGGGNTVAIYGSTYTMFYVGSNGYITFNSGDTDYTESLEDHFDLPRISGLFDDLNPSQGGTVSYRRLSDRIAVTWQNVPEFGGTGPNTFQIELFYDGALTISYLSISASDGLAGLSEGNGLPADFLESDLSGMPECGGQMLGDMNCDGILDAFDIDPFVLALTDPMQYTMQFPNCELMNADINGDGVIDAFDIDPFVELLTGG